MYVPDHFAAEPADIATLLASGGLAQLITPTADGLVATPLPLLYDHDRHALLGHVARTNEHWQAAARATGDSLAILSGPDAYISPSFYPSKREHGRVVPTWNYLTAHVHGRLVAHEDPEWLRALVTRLTTQHEASFSAPWAVSDAPPAYIDGQLRAIVGLELPLTRVEAKVKLSQNRSAADQRGVIEGLAARDPAGTSARAETVAEAMAERLKP
ncbi:MAG: FMN-binding negative transcriptional regulator [Frankiales bacterium]|jgi:transcriptional regulator|nr:FMN-binding negative transcriptional regulator [Frankiales bacterium]